MSQLNPVQNLTHSFFQVHFKFSGIYVYVFQIISFQQAFSLNSFKAMLPLDG
jgi:hypothetical protein